MNNARHYTVIPALRRLRQEDDEFKDNPVLYSKFQVSLGYIESPVSKAKKKKKNMLTGDCTDTYVDLYFLKFSPHS
jgi:hypothetical protein